MFVQSYLYTLCWLFSVRCHDCLFQWKHSLRTCLFIVDVYFFPMSKQLVYGHHIRIVVLCFLFTKEAVLSTINCWCLLLLLLFTSSLQNKEFVHRGLPYEQLGSFRRRLNYEFPNAEVGDGEWLCACWAFWQLCSCHHQWQCTVVCSFVPFVCKPYAVCSVHTCVCLLCSFWLSPLHRMNPSGTLQDSVSKWFYWCRNYDVMWCDMMWHDVVWCDVM